MPKKQNAMEIAFSRFDEITKRHLENIEKTYKGFGPIPEVKQPQKKTSVFKTPFGRRI